MIAWPQAQPSTREHFREQQHRQSFVRGTRDRGERREHGGCDGDGDGDDDVLLCAVSRVRGLLGRNGHQ
ncbi:hypothetical protein CDD83_8023 [Cordyceps sp. RAO-2017]|nr:hypothetical protein CDD83_8023 [Cordyceps sp. RAO-2017]